MVFNAISATKASAWQMHYVYLQTQMNMVPGTKEYGTRNQMRAGQTLI